ncbi:MAG: septum formation inhibitor Maf [Bryobacterales bacterium]|nr:septum formation inhibitor Maf [Bryobacterales bacterium]MBV9398954.1 septum formation inhibitor Maf [Bryobacterales bacterium]
MDLVLASQSPRRSELLRNAGFSFTVRVKPVEEVRAVGESPRHYAIRLARAKAEAAWKNADEVVLGADTIVVLGEKVFEKPATTGEAQAMLTELSGREHTVITGICLRHRDGEIADCESTRVHFVPLDRDEIQSYAQSGEPMDKAGAYAIQGLASKFVDRIEGCYFNVMGLPVARVYRHLKALRAI